VSEISQAIKEEQEASAEGSFKLLFSNNQQRFMYRTLLGMGGQMMQQISGINLITYVSLLMPMQDIHTNGKPVCYCDFRGFGWDES
jgi:hypothetical protein